MQKLTRLQSFARTRHALWKKAREVTEARLSRRAHALSRATRPPSMTGSVKGSPPVDATRTDLGGTELLTGTACLL